MSKNLSKLNNTNRNPTYILICGIGLIITSLFFIVKWMNAEVGTMVGISSTVSLLIGISFVIIWFYVK